MAVPGGKPWGQLFGSKESSGSSHTRHSRESKQTEWSDRELKDFREQSERREKMCDGCGIHPKDGLYSYTHCEHCMNQLTEKKMKQAKKARLRKEKEAMKTWTDEQWDAWAATQVPDIAVWSEEEYQAHKEKEDENRMTCEKIQTMCLQINEYFDLLWEQLFDKDEKERKEADRIIRREVKTALLNIQAGKGTVVPRKFFEYVNEENLEKQLQREYRFSRK